MIHLHAVSKVYGSRARAVRALADVTLDMGPGVWGVVGPNGAGKTTLLGLVLGFLHPTAGSVALDGATPRRYLRRHGAAYLPERFSLPAPWPVRDALLALARLEGHGPAEAGRRTDEALERMGLEPYADRPAGTLSRGLAQRVGLAQTLLAERPLVVLDEPTEGLDPLWRIRLRELVQRLKGEDRTVILASHELAEVERLADRVIVLDDGRVTDLMDARERTGGPLRYRLRVAAAEGVVHEAFPGAEPGEDPEREEPGAGDPGHDVLVTVADPGELSHRLAALLDAGGIVHAVTPLSPDLESRVRQRLEET